MNQNRKMLLYKILINTILLNRSFSILFSINNSFSFDLSYFVESNNSDTDEYIFNVNSYNEVDDWEDYEWDEEDEWDEDDELDENELDWEEDEDEWDEEDEWVEDDGIDMEDEDEWN